MRKGLVEEEWRSGQAGVSIVTIALETQEEEDVGEGMWLCGKRVTRGTLQRDGRRGDWSKKVNLLLEMRPREAGQQKLERHPFLAPAVRWSPPRWCRLIWEWWFSYFTFSSPSDGSQKVLNNNVTYVPLSRFSLLVLQRFSYRSSWCSQLLIC